MEITDDTPGNVARFVTRSGNVQKQVLSSQNVVDKTWHHLVGTRNNGVLTVYVDGVSTVGQTDTFGSITVNGNGPTIGDRVGDTEQLNGLIDEVRIYNRALTQNEILTQFNNQNDPSTFYRLGIEEKQSPVALTGWGYRKTITIDHNKVSADLTDFPVLINLSSDSDLADSALANGDDILFTAPSISWASGTENDKLAHEIEKYASAAGELQAWVRVPNLSSTENTVIYMYYGNAGAGNQENKAIVWDGNTKMVHHLQEIDIDGDAEDIKDSTQYGNNGTTYNMTTSDQVDGQIGGSLDFDGTDDWVEFDGSGALDITGDKITLSTWFKVNLDDGTQNGLIAKGPSDNTERYMLVVDDAGSVKELEFRLYTGSKVMIQGGAGNVWNHGEWNYGVGVYDGTNMFIYLNGVQVQSGFNSGNITQDLGFVGLARRGNARRTPVTLDEPCISNIARSAGWIQTEYNNQFLPADFYTLGSEEALPTIQFTQAVSNGAESLSPANLELALSAAFESDVTVDYTVTGGTATGGGKDYTLASGTAIIIAGDTTTTIDIDIIDDSINEPDETIEITISNPTNAILGTNTIHTYTILDNDVEQEEEEEEEEEEKKEYSSTDGKIYKNLKNKATSNGKVSYSKDPSPNDLISLRITPSFGEIEITIEVWNTSGDYCKKWKEDASSKSIASKHIAGDLKPSESYQVFVDGELFGTYASNSNGEIFFTYDKGYSEKTFEVKEEVAGAETEDGSLAETGKRVSLIFYLFSFLSAAIGAAIYSRTILKKNKIGS